jgi:hypothetical protein
LEAAKVEMAGFAIEIAAGNVTPERLSVIDARKAWLNENIPSFKVTPLTILFITPFRYCSKEGGDSLFFLRVFSN